MWYALEKRQVLGEGANRQKKYLQLCEREAQGVGLRGERAKAIESF